MQVRVEGLKHSEITDAIIRCFYEVYNELGYGFLESVYREAMTVALQATSHSVEREKSVEVTFRGAESAFSAPILSLQIR